ncbi:MAG TPA: class II glutamine amidotransferase [Bacteroidales bacterium]|jgi:amidophosphoribosyltransferase|nr:class II glutamine amidotransferase [Bacteroidales bacterium]MDI9574797.1 class II glutamine amidotransferase [Bacteroidota bacterium]OQC59261.1 MAG: Amidophosphoribosyltransferase precursor [Bacteroidetes bacterium ADurb.Bin012]MBP9512325.1 class II glutamine amidotransferase [Bacteroidales bacterium]MBP9588747.1 class II glutamine amidotransferase [Bacteroidales bacterium]
MSEPIKHECGIAFIRLLKPLEYYLGKYGTSLYGLNKLQLLMEKQHNRGQDGAGVACIKLGLLPGKKYINRVRSNATTSIKDVFDQIFAPFRQLREDHPHRLNDVQWLKENIDFTGEIFLGHLRYGTYGKNSIQNLHPFLRENNWKTRNLVLAGNFNLTNVDELFKTLVDLGQYPVETSDTVTVLERIGHFVDEENERLFKAFRAKGYSKKEITDFIITHFDLKSVLTRAASKWDGGYVMAGIIGHGDAFIMRDPAGIRPAYFYADDEVVIATSERPVIQTTLNVKAHQIDEIPPAHFLQVKSNGEWSLQQFAEPIRTASCSFERIYFSRGTDQEIYHERKQLGKMLLPSILKAIDYDLENTVFSYIPNTAAVAFQGLMEALAEFCDEKRKEKLLALDYTPTKNEIDEIFNIKPRFERIAVKDIKIRTFIAEDEQRDDLVAHVYDVTYGAIRAGIDNLVVLDDSIVRGTTLRKSIIRILDRLEPKHIIVASSAPQIRYPDCYGIDMAKLSDFIAFKAAIELLKETNQAHIINQVYRMAKAQENLPREQIQNPVKKIYEPFSDEEISNKISQLVKNHQVKSRVSVIFQTVDHLHQAIPHHSGDWYFTGNYPTPGGNKVVNKSFINFIEGKNERGY